MKNFFSQTSEITLRAKEFIDWLDATGRNDFQPTIEDILTQFAESFSYCVNGKLVAENPESLQQRLLIANNLFTSAFIHFPIKKMTIEGDKVYAQFDNTFIKKNGVELHTTNTIEFEFNKQNKVQNISQSFNPDLSILLSKQIELQEVKLQKMRL